MSKIAAEDAFLMLKKWAEERAQIQVVMSPAMRVSGERAQASGNVRRVLPHSRKALLILRDENGEDVGVTVDLNRAEWDYEDSRTYPPELGDMKWVCFLTATFPNGSRYAFGEKPRESEGTPASN